MSMTNTLQPSKRRPGIGRRTLIGIGVIVLMIVIALVVANPPGRAATVAGPATVAVTRGKMVGSVSGSGAIAAEQSVDLYFQSTGIVKAVAVAEGDAVQAGQVLAEVDTADLQLSLANAQAALNQQQARFDQTRTGAADYDLAASQANVDAAQANYDAALKKAGVNDAQVQVARASLDKAAVALQKAKADFDTAVADGKTDLNAVSAARQQAQIDYETAQANYNIQVVSINDSGVRSAAAALSAAHAGLLKLQSSPTAQDVQIAQAQLEQAKIALQQAQLRLHNAQLVAPFAGVVTAVNVTPGSSAGAASSAAIRMLNRNPLHISLKLSENDVVKAQAGQNVDLTTDSLAGWKAQGTVSYIATASETTNGVVTYAVRVNFADPDPRVKVGMTANVTIITAQKDNVLLVPNSALLPKGAGHIVQVLDANGRPSEVDVETGISDGTQTEILRGVSEGTRIVALPGSAQRPAGPFGN
jgi:HlyD family secretion protein